MKIRDWLTRVSDSASVNAVASAARVSQTTLNGQLAKGSVPAETVVKIARAYKAPVVASLVELGLITDAEAREAAGLNRLSTIAGLPDLDDADIVAEIQRRLDTRTPVASDNPLGDVPPRGRPKKRRGDLRNLDVDADDDESGNEDDVRGA